MGLLRSSLHALGAAGFLAGVGLLFVAVTAVSPPQESPEYVGSDLCAECHVQEGQQVERSVHGDLLEPLGDEPAGVGSCESCHGPGSRHVEMAATEDPGFRDAIDSRPEPDACLGCHAETRGQFTLPERHPVLQGFMDCSDCHDPHGSSNEVLRVDAQQATCTRCHADKLGPWVYPHAALEVEGCVACHQPHGSVNPHMLPYRQISLTCLSCHPSQPPFHTQPEFRECTACHVQIHGSNVDQHFLQ